MIRPGGHFEDELLDNAPVWILASDRTSGLVRAANRFAREELKLDQDDFHKLSEKMFWGNERERDELIRRQQEFGKATAEVEWIRPDGQTTWAIVSCQADPSDATHVLWWITDNSNQKISQLKLQQHQQLVEQVLDFLPIAVFAKDVKNNLRYVLDNRKSKEMFGSPSSGVVGKNDAEISGPEIAKIIKKQDLEMIRTGQPFFIPKRLMELPDGDLCYINTRKVLVKGPDGQPSLIVGVSEDITDQVEAERALKASEKRFHELVAGSPVGIFLTDARGAFIYVNEQWQKASGLTNAEAAAQGWAEALHPDDAERVKKTWQDYLENDHAEPCLQEFRFVRPDGQVTWVSSTVVAFKNDDDQVVGFIGSNTDITRRKQFETKIELSRDEANRANAAKSEFLSRMSHELRTPLNAVLGFGQLLQLDRENLTAKQAEGVAHILDAGEQLLHLIEDVLDFSRAESGNLSIKIQKISVSGVLQEAVSLVTDMAIQYQVELVTTPDADIRVLADQRRLQQILVKLLNNAIKYNRKDGRVEITVSSRQGGVVRINVMDTGRGIRPEDEARLFKSFEKITGPGDQMSGTGIGLSISKKLAELMGSTLGYSSKIGVGSDFWIDLPAATLDASAAQAFELTVNPELEADLRGMRILYIEETTSGIDPMLKLAQHIEDCAVFVTSNALEGIALAKSMRPDIILMGMNLPGLDGFSALELLGKDTRTNEIPVIAISSVVSPEVVQKGLAVGFAHFLTKPLKMNPFFQAVVDARTRKLQSESEGKRATLASH